jgi:hypothetical protein
LGDEQRGKARKTSQNHGGYGCNLLRTPYPKSVIPGIRWSRNETEITMAKPVTSKVEVNRMVHILCGNSFYEISDSEIMRCPHCRKVLEFEDCEVTHTKLIKIDPLSGDLSY